MTTELATCPICSVVINSTDQREINAHIDECLTTSFLNEGGGGGGGGGGDSGPIVDSPMFDMDSLLAQELGRTPTNEPDGSLSFKFTCPYPACNMVVVAYDFYNHAKQYHTACNQQRACPICEAESGVSYEANENTNLLQHLNNAHADMSEMQRIMLESRTSFLNQLGGRVELPASVGHGRTVKILEKNMDGKECPICFEEFMKGDNVAWLECFCMYHETCITMWYEKAQNEMCPVHRDDEKNE